MGKILNERNGSRRFERISRWNALDYTCITDNNKHAKYADNAGTGQRLTLTYFRLGTHVYPLKMFSKSAKIMLEDFATLSRQNIEDSTYYLEVNTEKDKVRLYREL